MEGARDFADDHRERAGPAALNYLLAERYQQEPERVASLVLIGNAFAIVFVPLGLTLGLHPV